jgi:hypothetical protein
MSKDEAQVKITTPGAPQAQQALKDTGEAAKQMGRDVEHAARGGVEQTGSLKTKTDETKESLDIASGSVSKMLGAFAGASAAIKAMEALNRQIEKSIELQRRAFEMSMTPLELGKGMSIQTGQGTEQEWAKKIIQLQIAGGFANAVTASEVMTAVDIGYSSIGGISSEEGYKFARDIAPDINALKLTADQASAVVKLAGTAGVKPELDAFRDYLAKIQAGYTKSESTDMGRFIAGLQTGGSMYIALGGSLEGAIANYTGTLSQTGGNEPRSATDLERMSRLAAGAFKESHQAIGEAYGVEMSNASLDQSLAMYINYAARIPENQRLQALMEIGIPQEVASTINTLATEKGRTAISGAYQSIAKTGKSKIVDQTERDKRSITTRKAKIEAKAALEQLETDPIDIFFQLARERTDDIYNEIISEDPMGRTPGGLNEGELKAVLYAQLLAEARDSEIGFFQKPLLRLPYVSKLDNQRIRLIAERAFRKKATLEQSQQDLSEFEYSPVVNKVVNFNTSYNSNYNYATQDRQTPNYSQDE